MAVNPSLSFQNRHRDYRIWNEKVELHAHTLVKDLCIFVNSLSLHITLTSDSWALPSTVNSKIILLQICGCYQNYTSFRNCLYVQQYQKITNPSVKKRRLLYLPEDGGTERATGYDSIDSTELKPRSYLAEQIPLTQTRTQTPTRT
jgi:hypothetical protein